MSYRNYDTLLLTERGYFFAFLNSSLDIMAKNCRCAAIRAGRIHFARALKKMGPPAGRDPLGSIPTNEELMIVMDTAALTRG